MSQRWWLPVALTLAACAGDDAIDVPRTPAALVNPFDWTALAPADDPFADHRPADAACPPGSWGGEPFAEQYTLEVQTGPGACRWLSARQPTLSPVAAGDPIRIRLWHFALTPERPGERAEAHAALALAGDVIWERRVVIPAEGGLLLDTVAAPRTLPAGAPLVFHLHNHGANTWNLLEVLARPDDADAGPP